MIEKLKANPWFAGIAGIFLAIGLLIEALDLPSFGSREAALECQGTVRSSQALNPDNIAKLMTFKTGASKDEVRKALKDPYCVLPKLKVRADTPLEREAYRVASDSFERSTSQTFIVVSYEGDQYLSYKFWVR